MIAETLLRRPFILICWRNNIDIDIKTLNNYYADRLFALDVVCGVWFHKIYRNIHHKL